MRPSGFGACLENRRLARVQDSFWSLVEFDPGSPWLNLSAALVNTHLVCLWPVGVLNSCSCFVDLISLAPEKLLWEEFNEVCITKYIAHCKRARSVWDHPRFMCLRHHAFTRSSACLIYPQTHIPLPFDFSLRALPTFSPPTHFRQRKSLGF